MKKAYMMVFIGAIINIFYANADCTRCKIIESERAKSVQKDAGYYDDNYPVHESEGITGTAGQTGLTIQVTQKTVPQEK